MIQDKKERRLVSVTSAITVLIMFILITVLGIVTFQGEAGNVNSKFAFAATHHIEIMSGLVIIAVLFGFVTAQVFYKELKKKRQDSKNILAVVLLFLSREEREIVNFLVQKQGVTTQAEISRLPHMNNVRAHRSLLKMQEKQILDVIPHGKVRRVQLKANMYELLLEEVR